MAGPRLEVEIGAKISELTTGLRKAQSDISKFSSTVQQQTKRTGTIFSDSAKEIAASQSSIAAGAQNWANTIQRSSKAIAPPLMTTQRSMELLGQTAERTTKSLANQGAVIQNVGRQSTTAFRGGTSAAMSFGHILQDIPYGINGVANNITQLTTQLGYMATSARAAGVSMRAALLSSIANPATIAVLAVSAITTAMVFFRGRVGKAKEATDEQKTAFNELTKSIDDTIKALNGYDQAQLKAINNADKEVSQIRTLFAVINDERTSREDRNRAIEQLQNEYPAYFANMSREEILTQRGADAYERLTQTILAAARARAAEEQVVDLQKQINDNNKVLQIDQDRLESINDQITAQQNLIKEIRSGAIDAASTIQQERELRDLQEQRAEIESRIIGVKARNIPLLGNQRKLEDQILDIITDQNKARQEGEPTVLQAMGGDFGQEAQKAIKKTADDATKEADRIRQAVEKAYQDGIKTSLSARDAEINATRVKYEELFNLANLSRDQIVQLNEAQANEIIQINEKFDEKERKALEKRNQEIEKAERKRQDTILKAEQGIRQIREQNAFDILSEAQQETETIQREYDNRLNDAIAYYAQLIALSSGSAAEIAAIMGKLNADIAQTEEARGAETERLELERGQRLTEAEKERLRELENLHRAWSRSLSSAFQDVLFEGENIFQAIGQAFKRMIAQMVADALAANILGALTRGAAGGFLGGLGRFIGSIFGGGGGGFGPRIGGAGQFASGGIVRGPTMGLVGEYPGASSNPEVISPLSELKKYIGGPGAQEIRIYGDLDAEGIHIANVRGEKKYNRFYKN